MFLTLLKDFFFLAVTMLLNFNKNKKNLQHDKKAERVKKKKMTDT